VAEAGESRERLEAWRERLDTGGGAGEWGANIPPVTSEGRGSFTCTGGYVVRYKKKNYIYSRKE